MEITLEQVERLRENAAVSYGQAKAALEYSGGKLLDALDDDDDVQNAWHTLENEEDLDR